MSYLCCRGHRWCLLPVRTSDIDHPDSLNHVCYKDPTRPRCSQEPCHTDHTDRNNGRHSLYGADHTSQGYTCPDRSRYSNDVMRWKSIWSIWCLRHSTLQYRTEQCKGWRGDQPFVHFLRSGRWCATICCCFALWFWWWRCSHISSVAYFLRISLKYSPRSRNRLS